MNPKPKFSHLAVYKFKPGQSGNVAGRPKSYMTILKELGYTKPVIATMVAELMFMPLDELYEIRDSRSEPAIRVAIAKSFCRAVYTGEYKYIADFLTILFGRPVPFIPEVPAPETKTGAE
jgi:hypothetical protein